MALPVVPEWCRFGPRRIHLGSRSSWNAQHLAVGLGAISLPDKIATTDAGPYMQDFGYELRRMGERRSSPKVPSTRPGVGDRASTASSFPRS